MGVWGMAPFENDDFGDADHNIAAAVGPLLLKKVREQIKRTRTGALSKTPHSTNERWATIGVILVAVQSTYLAYDDYFEIIEEAQTLLDECKADKEWLKSWRNPKAFAKMVKVVGAELDELANDPRAPKIVSLMFATHEKGG